MQHLILLYYILSVSFGTANLSLATYFYFKYRNRLALSYLLFLVILLLYVLNHSIYFYCFSILSMRSHNFITLMNFNYVVFNSALIYLIPKTSLILCGNETNKSLMFGMLKLLAIFFPVIFLITLLTGTNKGVQETFIYISGILLLLVIIWVISLFILNFRKFSDFLRVVILTGVILVLLFFPGFLVDLNFYFFQERLKVLPKVFNFLGLFFLIWNIFGVYYGFRFIERFSNLNEEISFKIPDEFYKYYRINSREKEILNLLLQGYTNKEISEKVYLSEGTVKNYIYNIFQKLNISNRMQILRKIFRFPEDEI